MATYAVSWHCGRVRARFRREPRLPLTAWDCNCSDCAVRRNAHFMVRASDFWLSDVAAANETASSTTSTIEQFEQNTILYQWGTKTAVRRFCRTCGILPFYIPRSNPDGYAITLPCVDDWGEDGPPEIEVRNFDGVHWEESHANTGIWQKRPTREDELQYKIECQILNSFVIQTTNDLVPIFEKNCK
ncbi:hypothetical protein ACHAXT_001603 [Thalassiosira profunda]